MFSFSFSFITSFFFFSQSRSQRPRSFWLATGIATSGQVQLRKSAIHGLPVTLRMLRVKSDKSDWFWSQCIVFTQPFKAGMSLGLARGPNISSAQQEGPLGTRLFFSQLISVIFFCLCYLFHLWDVKKCIWSRVTIPQG